MKRAPFIRLIAIFSLGCAACSSGTPSGLTSTIAPTTTKVELPEVSELVADLPSAEEFVSMQAALFGGIDPMYVDATQQSEDRILGPEAQELLSASGIPGGIIRSFRTRYTDERKFITISLGLFVPQTESAMQIFFDLLKKEIGGQLFLIESDRFPPDTNSGKSEKTYAHQVPRGTYSTWGQCGSFLYLVKASWKGGNMVYLTEVVADSFALWLSTRRPALGC